MKMKILGAAVATALLSVSAASFAQTGAAAGGQSNAGPGRDLQNGPAPRSGQGYPEETRGTTGNVIGAPATTGTVTTAPAGTSTVVSCDNLTGRDRTRCLRGERASGGSSMSPQDQYPARQSNSLPGNTLPGTASSGGGSGSGSGSGSSQ
ncbi:MAG: hypothetical protein ACM30H_10185 [Clostridia bacterium]